MASIFRRTLYESKGPIAIAVMNKIYHEIWLQTSPYNFVIVNDRDSQILTKCNILNFHLKLF